MVLETVKISVIIANKTGIPGIKPGMLFYTLLEPYRKASKNDLIYVVSSETNDGLWLPKHFVYMAISVSISQDSKEYALIAFKKGKSKYKYLTSTRRILLSNNIEDAHRFKNEGCAVQFLRDDTCLSKLNYDSVCILLHRPVDIIRKTKIPKFKFYE